MLSACTLDSWSGSSIWRMAPNQRTLEEAEAETWENVGQSLSHDLRPFSCTWVHISRGDVFSTEEQQLWPMGSLWDHPSWSKLLCMIYTHIHFFKKSYHIQSLFYFLFHTLLKQLFDDFLFCLLKCFCIECAEQPAHSKNHPGKLNSLPKPASYLSIKKVSYLQKWTTPDKEILSVTKGECVPFPTALSFVPFFFLFFFFSTEFHLPMKSDSKAQISGGGFMLSQLNNPSLPKYTVLTHNVCTLSLLTSGLIFVSPSLSLLEGWR